MNYLSGEKTAGQCGPHSCADGILFVQRCEFPLGTFTVEHAELTLSDSYSMHMNEGVLVLALLGNRGNEVEFVSYVCMKPSRHGPHSMNFTHGTLPRCHGKTTPKLPSRKPEVEISDFLD